MLNQRNLTYLEGMTADLNSKVMTTLTDGLSQGLSVYDIKQQIAEATDFATSRAEKIARTEIMNAVNEAAKGRYKQAGISQMEWLTSKDDRVCVDCEPYDGKIYKRI